MMIYFLTAIGLSPGGSKYKNMSNIKFAVRTFFCLRKSFSSTAGQQMKTFCWALYSTETPYVTHSSTSLVPILWHTSSRSILMLSCQQYRLIRSVLLLRDFTDSSVRAFTFVRRNQ